MSTGHESEEVPLIVDPSPSNQSDTFSSTWLLVLIAGLSGLLFGYDTGIISSTLLHLPNSYPLTTLSKSLVTSSPSLFALITAPLASPLADTYGRKPLILVSSLLFLFGTILQSMSTSVTVMIVGRSIVGSAIGVSSCITPLYICEISPADKRGRLVTVLSLFITGGQVVSYAVGWMLGEKWRWAIGIGILPSIIQMILLGGLLESPRYLILKGRTEEAKMVLKRINGDDDVSDLVKRIEHEVEMENGSHGWKDLWNHDGNRRALSIACLLQGIQQLCGFNVLMYFSATIFSSVGFTSPVATSMSVAGTNFLFTLVAFSVIDKIGRRRILLYSIPFMIVGLLACSLCFHDMSSQLSSSGLLVSLMIFVSSYALGLGCVPWQQSELFPLNVRSLGSGISTATNWSCNFIIGITFLPMIDYIGSSLTFLIYSFICLIGLYLIWRIYPETTGLELEDIGQLLSTGWGVEESNKRFVQLIDNKRIRQD